MPDTVTVDTASGTIELPAGLPDWVTEQLVEEANAGLQQPTPANAPIDNATTPPELVPSDTPAPASESVAPTAQGIYLTTPYGPVYVAPGTPDWVTQLNIENLAAGRVSLPAPTPGTPNTPTLALPPAPHAPTNMPAPVALPAPTAANPHPIGAPSGAVAGTGLQGAVGAILGVAGSVADKGAQLIGTAAGDVGKVASAILDATGRLIKTLIPTVEELALGMTSRFADLAGFLAEKTVDVATYAATMAEHAGAAMSVVLEDSWQWIAHALVSWFAFLANPAKLLFDELMNDLPGSAI